MKAILICSIIALFACLNQTEENQSKHIILPEVEPKEILPADTFTPIPEKELIIENEPDIHTGETDQSSKPDNTSNEELRNENVSRKEIIAETETQIDEVAEDNNKKESEVSVPSTTTQKQEEYKEAVLENQSTTDQLKSEDLTSIKEDPIKSTEEEIQEEVLIEPVKNIITKADHSSFAGLLKSFVSNSGDVNYKGFKSSESKLDAYLKELDMNAPNSDWSKNEQLAYWMNTYNAFTIKLIIDNYPVAKITDLHGGKPWDVKWIKLAGKTYSLNNIEHDIIRPKFNDPRIHFAVNCAAKSCPPLLNQAYTGENVNSLLNKVTKAFVNSSSNQLNPNSVQLSKIFEWYAEDFGNIINFLNQYSSKKIDSNAKIGYLDYNWALNEG